MKGKGELTLTGHLGDVMRESAQIAYSYVRARASVLGVNPDIFKKTDLHLDVPLGAIPKDGPSAGVAMVMAIASFFSKKSISIEISMTGEVTLRGRVLPLGGIKMKVLAADRAGMKEVIPPKRNGADLEELPKEVQRRLAFILVDHVGEVINRCLGFSLRTGTDNDQGASVGAVGVRGISGIHLRENLAELPIWCGWEAKGHGFSRHATGEAFGFLPRFCTA